MATQPIDPTQSHADEENQIVLHSVLIEILFSALKMPLENAETMKAIFQACLKDHPNSAEFVSCPTHKIGRLLRPADEVDMTDETMARLGRRALNKLIEWQESRELLLIEWEPGGLFAGVKQYGRIRVPFLGYAAEVLRNAQRHPKYTNIPTMIIEQMATTMLSRIKGRGKPKVDRADFRNRSQRRKSARETADLKSIQRAVDRARADGVDLSTVLPVILTDDERERLSDVSNSGSRTNLSATKLKKNEGQSLSNTLRKLENGPNGSQKFEILILVAGEIRGRIETATEPDSAAVSACLEMLQSKRANQTAPGSEVFGSETEKFSTGKNANLSACMNTDSGQNQPDDSSIRPTEHESVSAHGDQTDSNSESNLVALDESGLQTDFESVNESIDMSITMFTESAENGEIASEPEWLSEALEIALVEPESVEAGEQVEAIRSREIVVSAALIHKAYPLRPSDIRPSSPRSDALHAVALASLAEENHQTQHVSTETDPACADCVRDRVFASLEDYARQCGRYMQKFLIVESWNACGGAAAAPIRFDLLRLAYQKARDKAEQARRYQIE